jgi:hypothetical protein
MHAPTRTVTGFDEELHTLVRDMFATMVASRGVGLAATQVGVDLAVVTYGCPDGQDVVRMERWATPPSRFLKATSGASISRAKAVCHCRVRSDCWAGPIKDRDSEGPDSQPVRARFVRPGST